MKYTKIFLGLLAAVAAIALAVSCVKSEPASVELEFTATLTAFPADALKGPVLSSSPRDFGVYGVGGSGSWTVMLCNCGTGSYMAASTANVYYDASVSDPSDVRSYRYMFVSNAEAGLEHEFWFFNSLNQ